MSDTTDVREHDETDDERSLRDRLRRFIPRRRSAEEPATGLRSEPTEALPTGSLGDTPLVLKEKLASIEVAVDALDDRISAEVVEREAKLLEEIRRGMLGLEAELSERFVASTLEIKRTVKRGAALVIVFVALLAGLVVGVLSLL